MGGKAARRSKVGLIQCRVCGRWFRCVNHFHLRSKHGMTPEEYKREYDVAYVHGEAWREMVSARLRRARGRKPRRRYLARSREEILAGLRRYAGERTPLTNYWLIRRDHSLARQAVVAFGSWRKALEAAGLPVSTRERWSKARIIRRIRQRDRDGLSLREARVLEEERLLAAAAARYFGNWRKAVDAAGFDYDLVRRKGKETPAERTARRLREWAAEHGPLNSTLLGWTNPSLQSDMYKFLGSVKETAERLGLPYFYQGRRRRTRGAP